MSVGAFTDKVKKPDQKSLADVMGKSIAKWDELTGFLESTLKLKSELKFYGVNYGWAVRYVKSGKSVIALYPDRDGFTAQIILKRDQVEAAFGRRLSAAAKEAVKRARELNEGKWVYLPLDEFSSMHDVKTLVSARLGII